MELPKNRQPDAVPEHLVPPPPSLWMYSGLLLVSVVLVIIAFREHTDWPGLLVNLASGIFGAVIVLVFVERKLRTSEVQQVRALPRKSQLLIRFGVSATLRQVYRYGRGFNIQLRQTLARAVEPANVNDIFPKITEGLVVLGPAGSGKTTSLQFAAIKAVQEFLNAPDSKKAPILFPLRRWLPDRTLEQALFEHVNSYAKVSGRIFRKAMSQGKFIVILDGADELFGYSDQNFSNEFPKIRQRYPKTVWSVSSRNNYPTPARDLPVVTISPPTQAEIQEIYSRLDRQARS